MGKPLFKIIHKIIDLRAFTGIDSNIDPSFTIQLSDTLIMLFVKEISDPLGVIQESLVKEFTYDPYGETEITINKHHVDWTIKSCKDSITDPEVEELLYNRKADDPIYFLFGKDACNAFNEGEEELQEFIDRGEDLTTYVYTGNVIELMSEFNGWDDYIILTEEDYNTISDL